MTYLSRASSPLGEILLAGQDDRLTGLWFAGQRYDRAALGVLREGETEVFSAAREWLRIYFQGRDPGFLPPLRLSGSVFRQTVGEILLEIPFGKTVTYGAVAEEAARRLGKNRMSAQAAGGAVAHNPIALIVPCHRVVGAGGLLTGYAGGLERKTRLLINEGLPVSEGRVGRGGEYA